MDGAKEADDLGEVFMGDGFDDSAEEVLKPVVGFCRE